MAKKRNNNGQQKVGLVEDVTIKGEKSVKTRALFDTGATRTSIDMRIAAKAKLGPIIDVIRLRSKTAHTSIRRPIVKAKLKLKQREIEVKANIEDRSKMSYPVLIGRDAIYGHFIIDLKKSHKSNNAKDTKK
ncbi:RimK/LysX family protein [Nanoarchaeota archaeon]